MKLTRFRRFEAISALGACLFLGSAGLADRQALADPPAQPAGAPAAAPNTLDPEQLVEDSAKRMLMELDANRAMYAKDPSKLDSLVANVLLPNFDSEYAARLVLGQSWRTATPDQRKRFVDAFYHSLLRNYGNALLNFTGDNFTILPYKGDPGDTQATVRTEVKKSRRREGRGELQPAQDRLGLEGVGCRHRGHLLRQEFPHRLRLGDPAKGSRRGDFAVGEGRHRPPERRLPAQMRSGL